MPAMKQRQRIEALERRKPRSTRLDLSRLTDVELRALLEARDHVVAEGGDPSEVVPRAAEVLGVTAEHLAERMLTDS